MIASGDFETRSVLDLRVVGLDNYARHPSTDAWCLSYRMGVGAPVQRWTMGLPAPADLIAHVVAGGLFAAWNVQFEWKIWRHVMTERHGWPELRIEQCRCSMARSYAMALPGALEKAAPALGIPEAKDAAGQRLMLQMARPREVLPAGNVLWWDDADRRGRLGLYCDQDVVTEGAMADRMLPLSDSEQQLWLLDQAINERGLYVDRAAIEAAIAVVESEQARLNAEMRRVTNNAVATCNAIGQLGDWLRWRGVEMGGIAKADVIDALAANEPAKPLPADCRKALLLRQEAAKTSTAKLKTMLNRVSSDGRMRGTKQFHGAATGRWAGRGAQVDNYPRGKLKPDVVESVLSFLVAP